MYPLHKMTVTIVRKRLLTQYNFEYVCPLLPSCIKDCFKMVLSRPLAVMHFLALLIMKSSLSRRTRVGTIRIRFSSLNAQINCIISFLGVENECLNDIDGAGEKEVSGPPNPQALVNSLSVLLETSKKLIGDIGPFRFTLFL